MDVAPPQLRPNAQILQMLSGKWLSQAISVAATLGVADLLAPGPKAVSVLAADTGAHERSLYRLLRALASFGIFAEDAAGLFANTSLSEVLRSDVPGSIRGMARFVGSHEESDAWGRLLHSVRTGQSAFEHLFGAPFFRHAAKAPELAAIFNEAMSGMSAIVIDAVLRAFDFSPVATLADIGGGHGSLLASILGQNPGQRGVLFDQPEVVAGAGRALEAAGVAGRTQVVGGDFFQAVPAGADGYLLKYILHDWDDARALQILRNIQRAAAPGARLFVVEAVLAPGNLPSFGKLLDLEMLVLPGGLERSAPEYAALFAAAGFALTRAVPTDADVSILEATRT